jgi:hypothetical protein
VEVLRRQIDHHEHRDLWIDRHELFADVIQVHEPEGQHQQVGRANDADRGGLGVADGLQVDWVDRLDLLAAPGQGRGDDASDRALKEQAAVGGNDCGVGVFRSTRHVGL